MMAAHQPSIRHHPPSHADSHPLLRHDFDFRPSTSLTYDDAPSLPPPHTKQPSLSSLPSLFSLPSLSSSASSFSPASAFSSEGGGGGEGTASHLWSSAPFESAFSSQSALQPLPAPSTAAQRDRDSESAHGFASAPPSAASSPSPYASLTTSSQSQQSTLPSSRISAISPPLNHSFSQSHQSPHLSFLHSNPVTLPLSSTSSSLDDLPSSWRPTIFDDRADDYDDADLLKPHQPPPYHFPRPVADVLSPRNGRTHIHSNAASVSYGYAGAGEGGFVGYGGLGMGMGAVGGNSGYSSHSSRSLTPSLEPLDPLEAQLQGLSIGGGGGGGKDAALSQAFFSDRLAEMRETALSQASNYVEQQQQQVLQLQQLQQLVSSQLSRFDNLPLPLHAGGPSLPAVYGSAQLHNGLTGGSGSGLHSPHTAHLNGGVLVQVPQNSNLYVDQLPIPYSEHDLRQLFSPYGPIEKLRVATDPTTGTRTQPPHHLRCDEISQSIL